MPFARVIAILKQIEALDDADRVVLERQLSSRLDEAWGIETCKARMTAFRRKIDQAAIDRAIDRARYRA